jgi:tRNA pseudouridine65 synthase
MDPPLTILYQDEHLVAVDKPAGLLVHRSPVDRRERRFALQMVRDQIGRRVYPVHRLDRPTSGVLLFCLSPEIAGKMAARFREGKVSKQYLAVVRGTLPAEGRIDHPVKKIHDGKTGGTTADKAASAVTDFRRLATCELPVAVDRYPTSRYSLAALWPRTGRRHQLRLHMRHLRHPIIGDTRYGTGAHNRFFRSAFSCHRLLLMAKELVFRHPVLGETVRIAAGPCPSFQHCMERMGWSLP